MKPWAAYKQGDPEDQAASLKEGQGEQRASQGTKVGMKPSVLETLTEAKRNLGGYRDPSIPLPEAATTVPQNA